MNEQEIRRLAAGCQTTRDKNEVEWQGKKYFLLLWASTNGLNDCISRVYDLALKKGLVERPEGRWPPPEQIPVLSEMERTAANMFFNLAVYCSQNGIDLSRALVFQHTDNIIGQDEITDSRRQCNVNRSLGFREDNSAKDADS